MAASSPCGHSARGSQGKIAIVLNLPSHAYLVQWVLLSRLWSWQLLNVLPLRVLHIAQSLPSSVFPCCDSLSHCFLPATGVIAGLGENSCGLEELPSSPGEQGRYKTWTLDYRLDCGLDSGLGRFG